MKNAAASCSPATKLALAITPHFFNLIDRDDPDCPIRRQVIPRIEETWTSPYEMADPCGEDSHMPVPGLVHRYPDRVLFLVTDRCASYCRYCTRSRVVSGAGEQDLHTEFRSSLPLSRSSTPKCATCCSRGGDALLFSDDKLEGHPEPPARDPAHRVSAHRHAHPDFPAATHHAGALRDAAKISSALDERARESSARTDHGSAEALGAPGRMRGIPLGNQSVLLRGVNDDLDDDEGARAEAAACAACARITSTSAT